MFIFYILLIVYGINEFFWLQVIQRTVNVFHLQGFGGYIWEKWNYDNRFENTEEHLGPG